MAKVIEGAALPPYKERVAASRRQAKHFLGTFGKRGGRPLLRSDLLHEIDMARFCAEMRREAFAAGDTKDYDAHLRRISQALSTIELAVLRLMEIPNELCPDIEQVHGSHHLIVIPIPKSPG